MAGRNQSVELIKQRLNIVDVIGRFVHLTRNGERYIAPCPFHSETKPSFSVSPNGYFYCFGCQKHGDIFTFWMEYHGVSFYEAVEQLALEANVKVDYSSFGSSGAWRNTEQRTKRQQIVHLYKIAQEFFQKMLYTEEGKACRDYMKQRGIDENILGRFGLGWAPDDWGALTEYLRKQGLSTNLAMETALLGKNPRNGTPYDIFRGRLIFPIRGSNGETIAFGGRIIEKKENAAKYINSPDSPIYKKGNHLYGLDVAAHSIRTQKKLFLTEGYMDVVTLHQFDYTNAIAGLGTALTDKQVQRISGFSPEVFLVYDADEAGKKAALNATAKFLTQGLKVRVVELPEGEDIDSLLRKFGKEEFDRLCENALPGDRYCLRSISSWADKERLEWVKKLIASFSHETLMKRYVALFAEHWKLDPELFLKECLREAEKNRSKKEVLPEQTAPELNVGIVEREILRCIVRHPEHIALLDRPDIGCCIRSRFGLDLWLKILREPSEDVVYNLTPEERRWWNWCRGFCCAPIDFFADVEINAALSLAKEEVRRIRTSAISCVMRADPQCDQNLLQKELREVCAPSRGYYTEGDSCKPDKTKR